MEKMLGISDSLLFEAPAKSLMLAQEAYKMTGNSLYLKGTASLIMGKVYQQQRDYYTARKHYLESLELRRKWGSPDLIGVTMLALSENNAHLHHFDEAIGYARQAVDLIRKTGNELGLSMAYMQLASTHSWAYSTAKSRDMLTPRFSTDSALHYYKLAEQYEHQPDQKAWLHYGIGITYIHREDSAAVPYLEKAVAIRRKLGQLYLLIDAMQFLGRAQVYRKDYLTAEKLLDEAYGLYKSHTLDDDFLLSKIAFSNVLLHQATKSYKKAFEWLLTGNKTRDRRLLDDREGAISQLTVHYETEKKEALLKQRETELARQREMLGYERKIKWIMFGSLVLAIGTLGMVFYLYRKNRELSLHNATLVKEQNHRIKNNLQRLSSLMDLQLRKLTSRETRSLLQENVNRVQTIGLLHRHLNNTTRLSISMPLYLETLVEGLKDIYIIPGLRIDYRIAPVVLPSQQAMSLGLIVNEVVTNAFKHAFPKATSPQLEIILSRSDTGCHLQISDNGQSEIVAASPESIGLQLILLLARELKAVHRLSQENGTVFDLKFPLL
ncbi:MAG: hypothetical protein ABS46_05605 [Cytophagaceae bacterium SCN 52-12]|nr:MAG: hypothetical protein ABS46_05605 [Cytophagaceae bacterium SCN 52-12]